MLPGVAETLKENGMSEDAGQWQVVEARQAAELRWFAEALGPEILPGVAEEGTPGNLGLWQTAEVPKNEVLSDAVGMPAAGGMLGKASLR